MRDLVIWCIGGHSDPAQAACIAEFGYEGWWPRYVTPAVKVARRLGYSPVVAHRAPGCGPNDVFNLASFLNVRGTDWAATMRRETKPKFTWPWQAKVPPVEYRAYLASPEWTSSEQWFDTLRILASSGCGAYFEGVKDMYRTSAARDELPFCGAEPFWDRAYPIRWQDPCIVAEEMLDNEGRDFRGKNWNPHWVPLQAEQRRTLILRDGPVTAARLLEVEAAGWVAAVYAHRLGAMT